MQFSWQIYTLTDTFIICIFLEIKYFFSIPGFIEFILFTGSSGLMPKGPFPLDKLQILFFSFDA